jgi:hypothetical protein
MLIGFFIQCGAIICRNKLLYFVLTHQQETIKKPSLFSIFRLFRVLKKNIVRAKKTHPHDEFITRMRQEHNTPS